MTAVVDVKDKITKTLRKNGLKLTPQRHEIIAVLTADRSHPSATDIFQKARKKHPKISLSTVYSTLVLLKKLQLVKELEFEAMENRYDMDTNTHLNLICSCCGKIEDFVEAVTVPPEIVESQTGFKAHRIRLEYYGVCKECAK